MRRCPECYQTYSEGEKFCEIDGQPLLPDPAISASSVGVPVDSLPRRDGQPHWVTGLVGVSVGILLCLAVYIVYALWTAGSELADQDRTSYASRAQAPVQIVQPAAARASEPSQMPAEEEAEDAEAEASPEPEAETPATSENQVATARFNQGPVSTGAKVKDGEKSNGRTQTIILMHDGTSMEVDAAWEDKQGVWYRRGGLVSFVESQLVKAITARTEPKVPDETAP